MPSFSPDPVPARARGAFVPQPLGTPSGAPPAAPAPPVGQAALRAAREEGFAAGRAEGLAEGVRQVEREALGPAAAALEEAAQALTALRRHYLRAQRGLLVELALAVAARLLAREVEADRDALAGALERALEALGEEPASRVLLSERDLELVEHGLAPRLSALAAERGLVLEASPELASGDVRVLAERSEVDARRAELLRRLRAELDEVLDVEEVPA